MKKLIIGFMFLVLVALSACSSGTGPSTDKSVTPTPSPKKASDGGVSAQGYVVPSQHADLAFRAGGRVSQVLVQEGDQVKKDQPLIKLQDADLKAALAAAQAQLKNIQAGSRPEEIALAQANLAVTESQLASSKADLSRLRGGAQQAELAAAEAALAKAGADLKVAEDSYQALVTGHGIPTDIGAPGRGLGKYEENTRARLEVIRADYVAAQKHLAQVQAGQGSDVQAAAASVDVATAQRDAAQAQLDLTKAGATAEQIDAAKAAVAQAQAALDEATLSAPFDSSVAEITVDPGQVVGPGMMVVSLADNAHWVVETDDLSEVDVVNVQPGMDAKVTVDALPGVTLNGKVTAITPRSEVKRGDVTYTVKVEILNPDPALRWGMTAYVNLARK